MKLFQTICLNFVKRGLIRLIWWFVSVKLKPAFLGIKGIVDIDSTKINEASDNLTLGKYEVPVFKGASA